MEQQRDSVVARVPLGSFYLGPLVFSAVYVGWAREQPPPPYFGFVVTVDTNLNSKIKLWIALMKLGALTGCHQSHERSFFIRGYQFPLCARCTGLLIGQVWGITLGILYIHQYIPDLRTLFLFALISVTALGIDGLGQLRGKWISTNPRRFITGLACGFFVTWFNLRLIVTMI
jgi:uncharacterized membrane protein